MVPSKNKKITMQKSLKKYRMNNVESPKDSFEDLQNFGRFQILQYFLICLPLVTVAMLQLNYIFVAEDVNHRCRVPECDDYDATVDIPEYWPKDINARCFRPVLIEGSNGTCSNETFSGMVETCDEWIYEHNNSIVSELNLGCQSWKPMLVGSIHNAGMVFSMSITGWIADRFGRKLAMILCSVGGAVGLFKILLTNYYGYLVIEFLETVLASGLYTVGIVIMIEVGGESKRVSTGVIFCYAFYVGEVLFALVAMGLKYWKYIIIIIYAPMILFIFYVFILKESIRWQIINEKISEVKETLKVIAKVNKLSVTKEEITEITPEELTKKFNAVVQKETENVKHIIASKEMLIRLAVSSFCFFTSGLTYYGLAVHSVLLPGNKYINFILAALVSFPSDLVALFLMKRFGRKRTLQCGYVCLSVFLIASSFSPENMSVLKVVLFLFGKLGTVVCFTSIYTYGLELFPTSVRGTLFGTGNTAARVGSMIAPLTLLLTSTSAVLPSIIFSASALISAFLLMFTPETKTMPMFDTIAQVDHYMKKSVEPSGTDNFSFQINEDI